MSHECQTCAEAKLTKKPYKHTYATWKEDIPGTRWCVDTKVISSSTDDSDMKSIQGSTIAIIYVDPASRTTKLHCLPSRERAEDSFYAFIRHCSIHNVPLCRLHCDNEFIGKTLASVCEYAKVQLTHSPPNESKNVFAENAIRIIFDATRACLVDARLSIKYWQWAAEYCVYVYNRLGRSTDSFDIPDRSPLERLLNVEVGTMHLRVFGCTCYVFIHKQQRTRKNIVSVGRKCVFVGIDDLTPTYLCYDPSTNTIHRSRSVRFFEDVRYDDTDADDAFTLDKDFTLTDLPEPLPTPSTCTDYRYDSTVNPYTFIHRYIAKLFRHGTTSVYRTYVGQVVGYDSSLRRFKIYYAIDGQYEEFNRTELYQYLLPLDYAPTADTGFADTDMDADTPSTDAATTDMDTAPTPTKVPRTSTHTTPTTPKQRQRTTPTRTSPRFRAATLANVYTLLVLHSGTIATILYHATTKSQSAILEDSANPAKSFLPRHLADALRDSNPEHTQWEAATQEELRGLSRMEVFAYEEPPPGAKLFTSKWVFARKTNDNGEIVRWKARMVMRGYEQEYGKDYYETFSPVINGHSFRTLLSIAVQLGLTIFQCDISQAYLHSPVDVPLYMKVTPELRKQLRAIGEDIKDNECIRLRRALYGAKQSGRRFFLLLQKILLECDFRQSVRDECIFVKQAPDGSTIYAAAYVDDIAIMCKTREIYETVIDDLRTNKIQGLTLKDLGRCSNILGMQIQQSEDRIELHQRKYISTLLATRGYDSVRTDNVRTPYLAESKLGKDDTTELSRIDAERHRATVGACQYLATCSRPDIQPALSMIARTVAKPTERNARQVTRLMAYIKATADYSIVYTPWRQSELPVVHAYSDSDYASDISRHSRSGFVLYLGGNLVSWYSKLQSVIALSITEAEFYAMTTAATYCVSTRYLVADIADVDIGDTYGIITDSSGAIQQVKNSFTNTRSRHVQTKHLWLHEDYLAQRLTMAHVRSCDNVADIFTKVMTDGTNFMRLASSLFTDRTDAELVLHRRRDDDRL